MGEAAWEIGNQKDAKPGRLGTKQCLIGASRDGEDSILTEPGPTRPPAQGWAGWLG